MRQDEKSLKQVLLWTLAIIAVAVVVELAFWAFTVYQANKAVEDIVGNMQRGTEASQARAKAYQQQRQVELEQKRELAERQRQEAFNLDTYCAVNTDTNKCVCIHRKTGQRIPVQHDECMLRVSGTSNAQSK